MLEITNQPLGLYIGLVGLFSFVLIVIYFIAYMSRRDEAEKRTEAETLVDKINRDWFKYYPKVTEGFRCLEICRIKNPTMIGSAWCRWTCEHNQLHNDDKDRKYIICAKIEEATGKTIKELQQ